MIDDIIGHGDDSMSHHLYRNIDDDVYDDHINDTDFNVNTSTCTLMTDVDVNWF